MLTPVAWIVENYRNINDSYIQINALFDSKNDIYGYTCWLMQEWPMGNLFLAFNDEDYFWCHPEHKENEVIPYKFQNKEEAELAALNA